jgi:hypothetical protein
VLTLLSISSTGGKNQRYWMANENGAEQEQFEDWDPGLANLSDSNCKMEPPTQDWNGHESKVPAIFSHSPATF